MNNLDSIKVTCIASLNETAVSFDNLKELSKTNIIELQQINGREVALSIGEEEEQVVAYGKIVQVNGRYGVEITEIAED